MNDASTSKVPSSGGFVENSKKRSPGCLVWAFGFGVVCIATILWFNETIARQVRNSLLLDLHYQAIQKHHKQTGQYPPSYDGFDYWGRPLLYKTDGARLLMVSFGEDGVPDREYDLGVEFGRPRPSCFLRNRDAVFTEKHCVVCCFM